MGKPEKYAHLRVFYTRDNPQELRIVREEKPEETSREKLEWFSSKMDISIIN